jgi:hypothetical protein
MLVEERLLKRLDHLILKADEVRQTHRPNPPLYIDHPTLNHGAFMGWRAQAHSFLTGLLGAEHVYVENFISKCEWSYVQHLDAGQEILRAVREDVEGGYLTDVRTLISAEVFTDFLEMAEHLHENGYIHPAASLAGAVFEDGMRKVATANGVTVRSRDDLSSLNNRLAEASVYNR